jgi:penicillin amidase
MPRAVAPRRDWLATANNRPAPDDWPYPLFGTHDEGLRCRRIGRLVEAGAAADGGPMGPDDLTRMHADVRSLRAEDTLPAMLTLFGPLADDRTGPAMAALRTWDGESTRDSVGSAVYHVLTGRWTQAVVRERVPDRDVADYTANWCFGLASRLLTDDPLGWFAPGRREAVAQAALEETVDELTALLGADIAAWTWGNLHQVLLRHPLSGRGELGRLFDKGPVPVPGDLTTLNNSSFDMCRDARAWWATSGTGYRLEVDLGERPPAAWSITGESQSALLGSPHYDDQRTDWIEGRVHRVPLDRAEVEAIAVHTSRLEPGRDAP